MKRTLAFLLLVVAALAWWSTSRQVAPLTLAAESGGPGAYPADFDQRLSRVSRLALELNAPLPAGLPWQTAEGHPPVGSPQARKGGRVRFCNAGPFPAHFLLALQIRCLRAAVMRTVQNIFSEGDLSL